MPPKYDPTEYRNLIKMSRKRHLLVEGPSDKRLFRLLLGEASQRSGQGSVRAQVDIDSADQLVSFGCSLGNREKVEKICESARKEILGDRLVGFVDREYREFDVGARLEDALKGHRVLGRLVWSRGHSAETYFFEFETLREPLRAFSVTEHFDQALDCFERVFEATIRLACAASLAARECGMLRLAPIVDYRMVELCPPDVLLDIERWTDALCSRQGLSRVQADGLAQKLGSWRNVTKAADYGVVRWMCHGHAGLAFVWAVYSRCVHDACEELDPNIRESEARRVLRADESVRFNACASSWAARALGGQCEYPVEVLRLLGITEP
jgi:hypothetical protein